MAITVEVSCAEPIKAAFGQVRCARPVAGAVAEPQAQGPTDPPAGSDKVDESVIVDLSRRRTRPGYRPGFQR